MLLLLSFWLEIAFFNIPRLWQFKRILAPLLVVCIFVASFWPLLWLEPWFLATSLLLPFRLLNLARVIKGRMHPHYLRIVTRRTSWWIVFFHLAVLTVTAPGMQWIWPLLPGLTLFIAIGIFGLLCWHLTKTRHIKNHRHYSDKELPTISVCIPARNETDSLEQCLRSIIANDYPKLEILVLDDCSQDKTAEVIKSFAQDGVRFVQGDEPESRWLAKNQAYDKLTREATGDYILFCGVDVRLGPHAIKALVTTLLNRKKSMISVLPLRFYSKPAEAFVQPMRYWWELVPPRKLFKRPAVLSTCWLVDRKKLRKIGGFAAVAHAIIPEGYFARKFIVDDGYSFIRADEELDVRTSKPFSAQWSTAIRTNYPQIRRRPEMALMLTVFTLSVLILPFIMLPLAILTLNISLAVVSAFTCALLTVSHVLILQHSDPRNVPLGFISLPLAAFLEVVVGYASMLKYEFGRVEWKDRNVCIPVMHTIPKKDFIRQIASANSE